MLFKQRNNSFLIVFSLMILLYEQIPAQQDSLPAKKINFHTLASEYLPMPLLQVVNFNIGTEIVLNKQTSISVNLGYLNKSKPIDGLFQVDIESSEGIRGQLELRRYFHRHNLIEPLILFSWLHIFQFESQVLQNSGYYYSGQIGYQHTISERIESFRTYDNSNQQYNFTYSNYSVERNSLYLIGKVGYQCIKSYGLLIDMSYGFGAKWLDTRSINKQSQQITSFWGWDQEFDYRQGILPHFTYQIKLGWAF